MAEEKKLPPPSPTVERLRETFSPLAAGLQPHNEPAVVYRPEPEPK